MKNDKILLNTIYLLKYKDIIYKNLCIIPK